MATLTQLAEKNDFPVIVSLHPRTRARLDALGDGAMDERIRFLKPFGFLDYNCLQKNSACVVSDSGTIAEEASLLGFAAVTPRKAIERPEALDTGSIVISGLEPASILAGIATVMEDAASETVPEVPEDFRISDTSLRVVRLILGTARLSNEWAGVRSPAES